MAFERPEPPLRSSREDDPELELRIDVFVLQLGETVDELQDVEAAGRLPALGSLAHELKVRCSELGYESLADVARQIAAACDEQNPVAAHKAAAKDAKKNKEKFDAPAPKAKKLKVVKPSIDKEGAEKLIAELEAKAAAKGERKERPAKERSRGKEKRKGRDKAKAGRG